MSTKVKSSRGTLDRNEMDDLEPVSRVAQYRKAIVAGAALVCQVAVLFGTTIPPELVTAAVGFAGTILVLAVPNESVEVVFDPQEREQVGA